MRHNNLSSLSSSHKLFRVGKKYLMCITSKSHTQKNERFMVLLRLTNNVFDNLIGVLTLGDEKKKPNRCSLISYIR